MAWGLLIFAVIIIVSGITFIARDMESITPPAAPLPLDKTINAGEQFMLYRNAVIAYAIDHSSTPSLRDLQSYLAKNNLNTLPINAQNIVVQNGTNIIVCVWMPAPGGTLSQLENQFGNDMTIGLVNATNWPQPGPYNVTPQITAGCLGASKPKIGDIFSVVEIGN